MCIMQLQCRIDLCPGEVNAGKSMINRNMLLLKRISCFFYYREKLGFLPGVPLLVPGRPTAPSGVPRLVGWKTSF